MVGLFIVQARSPRYYGEHLWAMVVDGPFFRPEQTLYRGGRFDDVLPSDEAQVRLEIVLNEGEIRENVPVPGVSA